MKKRKPIIVTLLALCCILTVGALAEQEPQPQVTTENEVEDTISQDSNCVMNASYQEGLELLWNGEYEKAYAVFLIGAEDGDSACMARLGEMHRDVEYGMQDFAKALEWYRKAAEQGNAFAMEWLAYLYTGDTPDYASAAGWYLIGAEHGSSYSMHNLGLLYEHGILGEPNEQMAQEWYQREAEALSLQSCSTDSE